MADTKITGLTENTAPVATDITVIIDDPGGTPASQKVTLTNMMALFANPVSDDGDALGTTSLKWSDLFLASGAVLNFNSGNVTLTHSAANLTIAGGNLNLAAGTTTLAPLKFTAGTNLTTAEDGAIEMDADCFYGCTDAGNRGVIPIQHVIRGDSAFPLQNATGDQKLFGTPTNGTLTLETGSYIFDCLFAITGMSATSGNAYFDILGGGGATLGTVLYYASGRDNATDGAGGTVSGTCSTAAQSNAALVTASTATAMFVYIVGTFEVTAAGTIIPSIGLANASAATAAAGSFFRCNRIGSTSTTSVGQWT